MITKKEIRIFLKGQAKESFIELKKRNDKEAKTILNSFERVKEILKQNPQYGNPISKELIPEQLKKQGIKNLYRVELSNFWRMLYTLEGNEIEIFLFILTDHPTYNKLFGYKN
jgi:F0F1-type ATP synthase alpha subunit